MEDVTGAEPTLTASKASNESIGPIVFGKPCPRKRATRFVSGGDSPRDSGMIEAADKQTHNSTLMRQSSRS